MYTGLGWSLDNLILQSVEKHSEQVRWVVWNYTVELAFVLNEDEEIVKHEIVLLEVMLLVTVVKSCVVSVLEIQDGRMVLTEVKHLEHFQLVTLQCKKEQNSEMSSNNINIMNITHAYTTFPPASHQQIKCLNEHIHSPNLTTSLCTNSWIDHTNNHSAGHDIECHQNLFWQSKNILTCNCPFQLDTQIFFGVAVPHFDLSCCTWHTTITHPAMHHPIAS